MSSVVDEDTARTINQGRETIGAVLSSAQDHLQWVFIVFVIGFIGSFYALRLYVWGFLEATAKARMGEQLAGQTDIITRTPFEVILLQAKIGMFVGILLSIPAVLYFSRDALRRRGYESAVPISKARVAAFGLTSLILFVGGVVYAYAIFFPYAFEFLSSNAVSAGVKPSYGITEFTEFMALLTLSFGLAAQLPLLMGALSYTEVVPYETFRDRWRHAIVGITVFGAVFSPPDPFTQIMWATPMAALYVFSLGLAKLVTNVRRAGAAEAAAETNAITRKLLLYTADLLFIFAASALFVQQGGLEYVYRRIQPRFPGVLPPELIDTLSMWTDQGWIGAITIGGAIALATALIVLTIKTIDLLRRPVYPREMDIRTGDPDEIDLDVLDADGIRAAPPEVFLAMEEEEAMEHARQAMYDEDKEKAQAILDRFDSLQETREGAGDAESVPEGDAPGGSAPPANTGAVEEESGGLFSSTAAGMLDPFTEEETTEDDIGGYAYDLAFIFQSLTSKMFRIVGLFMLVMGGTFFWLYQGGLGQVLETFLDRVPEEVLHQVAARNDIDSTGMTIADLIAEADIVVAVHPVEVLLFEVKVSTLAAIIAVMPMVLYYAWPAAKERGLVRGDRRVFVVWGGSLVAGFAAGTYLGFFWIAPAIISYLVTDAINAGMVIHFRIKSFSWLVILTTVGIGFLMNIIVTMALFHVGGIVSYRTMLGRWRPAVVGIFTFAAFATPKGVLTMLIIAFPIAITYVIGLVLLYVLTLGGRLFGGGGSAEPGPEPEAEAAATPE